MRAAPCGRACRRAGRASIAPPPLCMPTSLFPLTRLNDRNDGTTTPARTGTGTGTALELHWNNCNIGTTGTTGTGTPARLEPLRLDHWNSIAQPPACHKHAALTATAALVTNALDGQSLQSHTRRDHGQAKRPPCPALGRAAAVPRRAQAAVQAGPGDSGESARAQQATRADVRPEPGLHPIIVYPSSQQGLAVRTGPDAPSQLASRSRTPRRSLGTRFARPLDRSFADPSPTRASRSGSTTWTAARSATRT